MARLATLQTPLGKVVVNSGRDYAGRDKIEVDLIPAEGCAVDFRNTLIREHTYYDYPALPNDQELYEMLLGVRQWLEMPQAQNARFRSHFGVYARSFSTGRWTLQVRPDGLTFAVADKHQLSTVAHTRKAISGITPEEKRRIISAIKKVFGDNLTPTCYGGEPIWDGTWFISCHFEGVAHQSLIAAMARYGQRDSGTRIDVFSPAAQKGFSEVLIPAGWRG